MSLMEQILALHSVDVQVRALRGRLDSAHHYLKTQETQMKDLLAQRDEVELQRKHTQAQVANLEMEANGVGVQIQKMRDELFHFFHLRNGLLFKIIFLQLKRFQSTQDGAVLLGVAAVVQFIAHLLNLNAHAVGFHFQIGRLRLGVLALQLNFLALGKQVLHLRFLRL